jgi:alkylhydroperoxidase/carboxymuconolactone decarboxylase family protein YurZ
MMLAALLLVTHVAVQDPRLERLDPHTRSAVAAVADSANGVGLPVEPIIQRALEGATKGASGTRIVVAVRRLAADLGTARSALGTSASAPELEAAVAALRAGATPQTLAHLRDVRRPPLTMALSVVADLVASGVPADSAAAAVLALAPKARDADLVEFRRAVERDIALGAPPGAATSVRVNAGAFAAGGNTSGSDPARPRRP